MGQRPALALVDAVVALHVREAPLPGMGRATMTTRGRIARVQGGGIYVVFNRYR